jgi:hypothetical protein
VDDANVGAIAGQVTFASGSYTAAFSCDDDTDADETLAFVPSAGVAVTVQNNVIAQVDITVPTPVTGP